MNILTGQGEHSDRGILLNDGSMIEGYTPQEILKEANNVIETDKTGVYLSLRQKKKSSVQDSNDSHKNVYKELQVFLNNAWYFYEHKKEICADSRFFLAPVPVCNGIAYTGTSGFHLPTLGVYVEWWHTCKQAVIELEGQKWLIWRIAGSPLSGMNKCSIVNVSGESRVYTVKDFIGVWPSFIKINKRYDEAKERYMSFTIKEVETLMRYNNYEREMKIIEDSFNHRSQIALLFSKLNKAEKENKRLHNKLNVTIIQLHENILRDVYDKYLMEKRKLLQRREELQEMRYLLRSKFKDREISQTEYQNSVSPINKENREINDNVGRMSETKIEDFDLTIKDLIDYFESDKYDKRTE